MDDLTKHINLSERFEALRAAANLVLEELDGADRAGGRLDRSADMLTGAITKMAAELHRRSYGSLHRQLQRAGVDLFHPAAAESARELAKFYADKP